MEKDVKQFLKQELERGTYFLKTQEISAKLKEIFHERSKAATWDSELDDLSCELLAGLSVYDRSCAQEFKNLIEDTRFSKQSKVKALNVLRYHLVNPDHASSSLELFGCFLNSNDPSLVDFSTRSFLQILTEMRVGGQMPLILKQDENREGITRVLKSLSEKGWMEAGELLDLLDLLD